MLENIHKIEDLTSLARRKSKKFDTKAIHSADLEKYKNDGWAYVKKLKTSIQVKKEKAHGVLLEDRVWNLFYKMKFLELSGIGGAKIILNPKDSNSLKSQIDIVAIDNEVALAVECK